MCPIWFSQYSSEQSRLDGWICLVSPNPSSSKAPVPPGTILDQLIPRVVLFQKSFFDLLGMGWVALEPEYRKPARSTANAQRRCFAFRSKQHSFLAIRTMYRGICFASGNPPALGCGVCLCMPVGFSLACSACHGGSGSPGWEFQLRMQMQIMLIGYYSSCFLLWASLIHFSDLGLTETNPGELG